MSPAEPRPRPLLLGHRGARDYAPENTLQAFDLALRHGCDGFEFDVRRTADGRSVICHDAKLFGLVVARNEFAKLSERGKKKGCEVASLEQVLERFASSAFLDIELKVGGLERTTVEALRQFPPARGYFVSSFLPGVVEAMRDADARVPLGLICDRRKQLARWKDLPVSALFLHKKLATDRLMAELHQAGKQVFVWTVNVERQMQAFRLMRVDGIISDDTKLLAAL